MMLMAARKVTKCCISRKIYDDKKTRYIASWGLYHKT
jgi:hypothetical protein